MGITPIEAIIVFSFLLMVPLPLAHVIYILWMKHNLIKKARTPRERVYFLRLYNSVVKFRWWHAVVPLVGAIGLVVMTIWWRSA